MLHVMSFKQEQRATHDGRHLWDLRANGTVLNILDLNQQNYTRPEAMAICALLVDAVNRWPKLSDIALANRPSVLSVLGNRMAYSSELL